MHETMYLFLGRSGNQIVDTIEVMPSGGVVSHVILVSAEVLLVLTLGLWTSDLGLTITFASWHCISIPACVSIKQGLPDRKSAKTTIFQILMPIVSIEYTKMSRSDS